MINDVYDSNSRFQISFVFGKTLSPIGQIIIEFVSVEDNAHKTVESFDYRKK